MARLGKLRKDGETETKTKGDVSNRKKAKIKRGKEPFDIAK